MEIQSRNKWTNVHKFVQRYSFANDNSIYRVWLVDACVCVFVCADFLELESIRVDLCVCSYRLFATSQSPFNSRFIWNDRFTAINSRLIYIKRLQNQYLSIYLGWIKQKRWVSWVTLTLLIGKYAIEKIYASIIFQNTFFFSLFGPLAPGETEERKIVFVHFTVGFSTS